ncbi:RCC1 domain-containing protein [Ructibacterium gallinarum]|uniref:Copper amine oxidase-like N-terminal domain-containing protein n=1 Tax=Ructibacterium gallinarum TaxID=2779355 RepID=A0A9D5R816_9FIRM|nr:stalk domain-containing protein [Ructibacterium gallinarum]MBE5039896.1 hypothetical protein [Ructibacterium gallinarum]
MKRNILCVLLSAGLCLWGLTPAAQEQEITVTVDGAPVVFADQQPVMEADRILIPIRGVFEAMGAEVTYLPAQDGLPERALAEKDGTAIVFQIDGTAVSVTENGENRTEYLDVPARLMNDRTMIPLRFLAETLGYTVDWIEEENRAEITAPDSGETPDSEETPDSGEAIQNSGRVALGQYNGMAIAADGSVYAWGDGEYGQLGGVERAEEPVLLSGLSGAVAAACGRRSMYVLKSDGTVWSWGYNGAGELGRKTEGEADPVPGQVEGLSGITAVSAGENFALALSKDGKVYSWGDNRSGQLGLSDTENRQTPQEITAISGRVISLSAGSAHGAAVTSDQTVWLWGSNSDGQLAKPKGVKQEETPFRLSSISRITAVSAGEMQTLALRTDGSVYMWGTTYIGLPKEETGETEETETPSAEGESGEEEAVVVKQIDEEGYYRYDEPLRMRYIYYDMEWEEDRIQILIDAAQISAGGAQSAALVDGKLYVWGDSPLMPYRLKDQNWRYYAQEYTGLDGLSAVYAGREKEVYMLQDSGQLWRLDSSGKTQIMDLGTI